MANKKLLISSNTAYVLLGKCFGKTKIEHGITVYNEEYTVLYPHKSDACAECVRFMDRMASDRQTLMRHQQQSDRTLLRLAAMGELKV